MLMNGNTRGSRRIALFALFIVTLFTGSCSGVLYFDASQKGKESSDSGLGALLALLSPMTVDTSSSIEAAFIGAQLNLDVMDRLGPALFATPQPPTVTAFTDIAFFNPSESSTRLIILDAFGGQLLFQKGDRAFGNYKNAALLDAERLIVTESGRLFTLKDNTLSHCLNIEEGAIAEHTCQSVTSVKDVATDGTDVILLRSNNEIQTLEAGTSVSVIATASIEINRIAANKSRIYALSADALTIQAYDRKTGAILFETREPTVVLPDGRTTMPVLMDSVALINDQRIAVGSKAFNKMLILSADLTPDHLETMAILPKPFRYVSNIIGVRSAQRHDVVAVFNSHTLNIHQYTTIDKYTGIADFLPESIVQIGTALFSLDIGDLFASPNANLFELPEVKTEIEEALAPYVQE